MFIRQRQTDNPSAIPLTFQFSPHSSTSTLRKHIENYHEQEYINVCASNGWKNQLPKRAAAIAAQVAATADSTSNSEPFSDEAFLHKIINWVVTDDQVSPKYINCSILIFYFFQFSPSELLRFRNYANYFFYSAKNSTMRTSPNVTNFTMLFSKHGGVTTVLCENSSRF